MKERGIKDNWINETLASPDIIEEKEDNTKHYIRAIDEREERYLRVIVNPAYSPVLVVTMFFDRRLRRKQ